MNATRPSGARGAGPAPLETLLQRWRTSIELHLRYASLDDERYWQVQPWPKHERPIPAVLNLAREKLDALERIARRRMLENDRAFNEALEIMAQLATLVGLQSVERYIPLADPATERAERKSAERGSHRPEDATRQMPALHPGKLGRLLLAQQAGVPYKPRSARHAAATKAATAAKSIGPAKVAAPKPAPKSVEAMVVDDVLRLIGWGRKTHELPELIATLHGRPAATAVRRIIKDYRVHIARQLGAS